MFKKVMQTVLLFSIAFVFTGCAKDIDSSGGIEADPVRDIPKSNWEASHLFDSGIYTLIGEEGRTGFIYDDETTRFYPKQVNKYMWHFWGSDDELNGTLKITAVHENSGEEITIFEDLPKGGANNGADQHAPSTFSLPESGIWRLDAFFGDEFFGSIFVPVHTDSHEFLAQNEGEISIDDSETAFEMCVRALTDYYRAIWNGSIIELDLFIENVNLKQYTSKKIQYHQALYSSFTDSNEVQNVEAGAWEVQYLNGVDGGLLYFKLPVVISKSVGSRGEVTEFLVHNVNGKLVIADWYNGGKDSYDFMVRGENETIDNLEIWNDREWVKELERKQSEFTGSIH